MLTTSRTVDKVMWFLLRMAAVVEHSLKGLIATMLDPPVLFGIPRVYIQSARCSKAHL